MSIANIAKALYDNDIELNKWYGFGSEKDQLGFLAVLVITGKIAQCEIDHYKTRQMLCVTIDGSVRYRTKLPKELYRPAKFGLYKYNGPEDLIDYVFNQMTKNLNEGETIMNVKNIETVVNYVEEVYREKLEEIKAEHINRRLKFAKGSKNGIILTKAFDTICANLKLNELPFENPEVLYDLWLLDSEEYKQLKDIDANYNNAIRMLIARRDEAILLCKAADTYEQIYKILSDYNVLIG